MQVSADHYAVETLAYVRPTAVLKISAGGLNTRYTLRCIQGRLVAIDPDRAGIGGLRLQLELALFAGPARVADPSPVPVRSAPAAIPVVGAPPHRSATVSARWWAR